MPTLSVDFSTSIHDAGLRGMKSYLPEPSDRTGGCPAELSLIAHGNVEGQPSIYDKGYQCFVVDGARQHAVPNKYVNVVAIMPVAGELLAVNFRQWLPDVPSTNFSSSDDSAALFRFVHRWVLADPKFGTAKKLA
jgi:hypothetical protein